MYINFGLPYPPVIDIEITMPEVIQGNQLNARLDSIIEQAKSTLVLVSPYIRLHHRIADSIRELKKYPEVDVFVCFGKAQGKYANSFHPDAIELLKSLPNIRIVYDERLHAKFYGNEQAALITSMNLYDYSQDNNIEVGVYASKDEGRAGKDLHKQAHDLFQRIVENAIVVYDREPEMEKTMLGLREKYLGSKTIVDLFEEVPEESKFTRKDKAVSNPSMQPSAPAEPVNSSDRSAAHKIEAPKEQNLDKMTKPEKEASFVPQGYCIRTGVEIPFDIEKPFSYMAFQSWSRFGNPDYEENYCHFSGEESFGETSMNRPILNRNWNAAKKHIK